VFKRVEQLMTIYSLTLVETIKKMKIGMDEMRVNDSEMSMR